MLGKTKLNRVLMKSSYPCQPMYDADSYSKGLQICRFILMEYIVRSCISFPQLKNFFNSAKYYVGMSMSTFDGYRLNPY